MASELRRIFPSAVVKKSDNSEAHLFDGWAFGKKNYLLFTVGLIMIAAGYIIMAAGEVNSFQSLTLAPIMLFAGYMVIIPLALMWKDKNRP